MRQLFFLLLPLNIIGGPFFPFNSNPIPEFGVVSYADVASLQYPTVSQVNDDFLRNVFPGTSNNKNNDAKTGSGGKVCLSESCVLASAHLLEQMDTSVDPCQDFYKFTCGKYIEKNLITLPEHKTKTSKSLLEIFWLYTLYWQVTSTCCQTNWIKIWRRFLNRALQLPSPKYIKVEILLLTTKTYAHF